MKILVLGLHLDGNFGDAAAGTAFVKKLTDSSKVDSVTIVPNGFLGKKILENNSKVMYYTNHSKSNSRFIRIVSSFIKTLKLYMKSDVVCLGPCGSNIGIYKDKALLRKLLFGVLLHKKVVFCLNSINDSKDKKFNKMANYVLKRSCVFVREKSSYDYLKSLGINVKFGIDSAFNLPKINNNNAQKGNIIFIPSNMSWHPNLKDINFEKLINSEILPVIADIANQFDYEIRVLQNFVDIDSEDAIVKKIAEKTISGKKIEYCRNVDSFEDYDCQIANATFVVSMRYHGMVLSAKNNVPFIGISYEQKMNEVAQYCGLNDCVVDVKNFDRKTFSQLLQSQFDDLQKPIKNLTQFRESELYKSVNLPIDCILD